MFDPRLEQNEEGLYDAPHIELIWMMNTGNQTRPSTGPPTRQPTRPLASRVGLDVVGQTV